jgi:hypothetical protein
MPRFVGGGSRTEANGEVNWQESVMTAIAKVIQRLEPSSGINSRPIPDFAALMLITRFTPYRPELHYMRGPGPKWHAKHDPRAASPDGDRGGVEAPNGRRRTSDH